MRQHALIKVNQEFTVRITQHCTLVLAETQLDTPAERVKILQINATP